MKTELDTKILNKNLQITKLLADNTEVRSKLVDLKERMKSPFMLNTLEECYIHISNDELKKDLRRVISFLQQ